MGKAPHSTASVPELALFYLSKTTSFFNDRTILMYHNAFMLVVASCRKLSVDRSEYGFVSFVVQPGSRSQAENS